MIIITPRGLPEHRNELSNFFKNGDFLDKLSET
jgi:hypothetical protein